MTTDGQVEAAHRELLLCGFDVPHGFLRAALAAALREHQGERQAGGALPMLGSPEAEAAEQCHVPEARTFTYQELYGMWSEAVEAAAQEVEATYAHPGLPGRIRALRPPASAQGLKCGDEVVIQGTRDGALDGIGVVSASAPAGAPELIAAYDEYIALLEEVERGMTVLAFTHGYRCPDEMVKRGQQLREKIAKLKTAIAGKDPTFKPAPDKDDYAHLTG